MAGLSLDGNELPPTLRFFVVPIEGVNDYRDSSRMTTKILIAVTGRVGSSILSCLLALKLPPAEVGGQVGESKRQNYSCEIVPIAYGMPHEVGTSP